MNESFHMWCEYLCAISQSRDRIRLQSRNIQINRNIVLPADLNYTTHDTIRVKSNFFQVLRVQEAVKDVRTLKCSRENGRSDSLKKRKLCVTRVNAIVVLTHIISIAKFDLTKFESSIQDTIQFTYIKFLNRTRVTTCVLRMHNFARILQPKK